MRVSLRAAACFLPLALLLSCDSPFEPSVRFGSDILSGQDPTIADPYTTISVISTSLHTATAFSRRDTLVSDSATLIAGVWNGLQSNVYFEFDTVWNFTNTSIREVHLRLLLERFKVPVHSDSDDVSLSLLRCSKKEKSVWFMPDPAADTMLSVINEVTFRAFVPDSLPSRDSVAIPDSFFSYDSINDTLSRLTINGLAFGLVPSGATDGLVRLQTPLLKVLCRKILDPGTDSVRDTTIVLILNPDRADRSVIEPESLSLDGVPFSVTGSGRRAIIKVPMRPIWGVVADSSEGRNFQTIIAANIRVPLHDSLFSLETGGVIDIWYSLTDADTLGPASGLMRKAIYSDTLASLRDLTLTIQKDLNRLFTGARPDTAYLQLLLPYSNAWKTADWRIAAGDDIALEMVLTDPRQNR